MGPLRAPKTHDFEMVGCSTYQALVPGVRRVSMAFFPGVRRVPVALVPGVRGPLENATGTRRTQGQNATGTRRTQGTSFRPWGLLIPYYSCPRAACQHLVPIGCVSWYCWLCPVSPGIPGPGVFVFTRVCQSPGIAGNRIRKWPRRVLASLIFVMSTSGNPCPAVLGIIRVPGGKHNYLRVSHGPGT